MKTIEFTHQGYSALLGAFSPGERKTVTAEQARHFVCEAMAAVLVPDAEEAPAALAAAPQKPARKPRAAAPSTDKKDDHGSTDNQP